MIVDIECHLSNNLPNIVIVGSASKSVDESRERIRGAFATSHIMLPRKRITVNLAPADVPKGDSGFDLAIAAAIWQADGQIRLLDAGNNEADVDSLAAGKPTFIGELGLDGGVRPVRGIIGKILAGRSRGISTFYIPAANLRQAQLVPKVKLMPVNNLLELYGHLTGLHQLEVIPTVHGKHSPELPSQPRKELQLSEIAGQDQAKRALEIAAAGGHNVFFSGPPGTGKSMLAKALPGILPPLNREEVLEVTHLHSLAGHDYEKIVVERPFQAPHHSASRVSLTGGGSNLRPGEISLAHRGVLFLDELPEFGRAALEALRQPLEDRIISILRASGSVEYPANFILVATANPCPCGFYGVSGNECYCEPYQVAQYNRKLSGPILDRIDLYSNVHKVEHKKLLRQAADQKSDETVRQSIQKARKIQTKRFGNSSKLNADMTNQEVKKHARLESAAANLLNTAARNLNLSARGYMRTVKVARTIADLDNSQVITSAHLTEALAYRQNPKN